MHKLGWWNSHELSLHPFAILILVTLLKESNSPWNSQSSNFLSWKDYIPSTINHALYLVTLALNGNECIYFIILFVYIYIPPQKDVENKERGFVAVER